MSNIFNTLKMKKPRGNVFNLSHEKKLSCNMGELIPVLVQDVLPGDRFKVNSEILLRFAPLAAPVMHRVNVFLHFWFVPNRLVWPEPNGWETFITGGPVGASNPSFPMMEIAEADRAYIEKGSLCDYMGIPVPPAGAITANGKIKFSDLPFRAYQKIYRDFYIDQTLGFAVDPIPLDDTTDPSVTLVMQKRCWEKDYFTSCMPYAQRGGDVLIPRTYSIASRVYPSSGTPDAGALTSDPSGFLLVNGNPGYIENLDSVGMTINDLRVAARLQEWLERNSVGGARYIEQIKAHFGIVSSDSRLQRAEYLGGGKAPVVISEVLSTAQSASYEPGEMFGHGVSIGNTNSFNRFFEEHGYVIGILSVLPRTAYQQGLERHFSKFDRYDYYFPEFAHLGEQAVERKEIFYQFDAMTPTQNEIEFGYQSRYAEYKSKLSSVHGDFRDNLAFWHLGRIFSSYPNLDATFTEADPAHRIFNVIDPDVDKLYVQIYHNMSAWRLMPTYGLPKL